jgi:hypothetical protein
MGSRNRHDPEAVRIAHHRLQHVGGLSQPTPAEGGVAHGADQGIDTVGGGGVQRRQRCEAVVVSGSVVLLVAGLGHGPQV